MLRRPDPKADESKKALFYDIKAVGRALAATSNKSTLENRNCPRSISTGSESPQTIPGDRIALPPLPRNHRHHFIWKWKPLKALTHARRRRFCCRFTVRIHSVRGLAPAFEGRFLFVQWRRAGDDGRGVARTRAVRVVGDVARFEETAVHLCFVYGNRGGRGGAARYEERQFVLHPSVVGAPEIDLGRHRFDITRLLPLEMEEMEKEGCSGEWATGFKLSGKGKGATVGVTFGFSVLKGEIEESGGEKDPKFADCEPKRTQRSLVNGGGNGSGKDVKPTLHASSAGRGGSRILRRREVGLVLDACKDAKGELESKKLPEINHSAVPKNAQVEAKVAKGEESTACDSMVEELAAAFDSLSIGLDVKEEGCTEAKSGRVDKSKSLSLDNLADSASSDFLMMIGVERSSPDRSTDGERDSPRERLWRQFKRESLGSCFLESPKESLARLEEGRQSPPTNANSRRARFEVGSDSGGSLDLSLLVRAAENEHQKATQVLKAKAKAKLLEDAEAEALMREWGMDEKAFAKSPPPPSGCTAFGSPIELPLHDPLALPPPGEGMGPFLQTKDGGYLRTMSPSLLKCSKNNGSLVMQVSRPVVVPAEMGADVMDILQSLASLGVEKLSVQARKLMPLEDITGKTMQQLEWESLSAQEADGGLVCFQAGDSMIPAKALGSGSGSGSGSPENGDETCEFVSLEELAPSAMNKIEALSLQGLRIQTGLADEGAPSNVGSKSCLGVAGLQLLDAQDSKDEVDGLMGLSITLDEWMRLDSGEVNEEDMGSERTSRILAAHHANSADLVSGGSWRSKKKGGKGCGRKGGLLGNNFTIALMVQLRDPMRNYEPVGTPMLSLVQVERIFVPPKMKVHRSFSEKGEEGVEGVTTSEEVVKREEKPISQFTIKEVHVAGLKIEHHQKKRLWGNAKQQTSGSRWLIANGMGKNGGNKHPLMKSKAISRPSPSTTTVKAGDTLWSISSRVNGKGGRWKELAALNPHIRNPNVIFPDPTIRLR